MELVDTAGSQSRTEVGGSARSWGSTFAVVEHYVLTPCIGGQGNGKASKGFWQSQALDISHARHERSPTFLIPTPPTSPVLQFCIGHPVRRVAQAHVSRNPCPYRVLQLWSIDSHIHLLESICKMLVTLVHWRSFWNRWKIKSETQLAEPWVAPTLIFFTNGSNLSILFYNKLYGYKWETRTFVNYTVFINFVL